MANAPGVSARIVKNSHPAKTVVATAVRAKSRLARASRRCHQTSKCSSASVRQADAIIAHMMVTQLMASQSAGGWRRLNTEECTSQPTLNASPRQTTSQENSRRIRLALTPECRKKADSVHPNTVSFDSIGDFQKRL